MASDRLRLRPEGVAVVLAVELCTLTLLLEDVTKVNLVGTALFGDGAGAAVLVGGERGEPGPSVVSAETHRFPGSGHLMGWAFSEDGFRLVLDPGVPAFIHEALPPVATAFLERNALTLPEVRRFALHPGGRQVLEAYRRGFGLPREVLEPSARALRDYGNLSSASVLFSLDELWRDGGIDAGEHGFVAAMGPGFAAELILLRG
jgi:alkylresorcinol/alkylpyrone synthase